jgi:hypothetical protein
MGDYVIFNMKPDITHRSDIKRLIDTFYEKVKADSVIGYIFNDIAHVDWPKHLPVSNHGGGAIFRPGSRRGQKPGCGHSGGVETEVCAFGRYRKTDLKRFSLFISPPPQSPSPYSRSVP